MGCLILTFPLVLNTLVCTVCKGCAQAENIFPEIKLRFNPAKVLNFEL